MSVSPYISITPDDRQKMLGVIQVRSEKELFKGIPEKYHLTKKINVDGQFSEFEIKDIVARLFGNSVALMRNRSFLGGGIYDHYVPAAVNQLTLRGEFLTAYTPYQPEISQGTLQALFEYQSMVASLLGLYVANASHYDGATALADAALMALRTKSLSKVFVSKHLHPDYLATLRTYLPKQEIKFETIDSDEKTGTINLDALEKRLKAGEKSSFLVIVQSPNYLGIVEPVKKITALAHQEDGVYLGVVTEPLSLGILESPGALNADIAVGEGQSFGIPPSFGGPYIGLLAATEEYLRQIPGRLCGKTVDKDGKDSYTLTLSTREQHIRRAKATSNICSNQNLCGLAVAIYLSLLGKKGLKELAIQNLSLTEYLKGQIKNSFDAILPYSGNTFNEFVVRFPKNAEEVCQKAYEKHKIILGLPLTKVKRPKEMLVTVTETKTKDDLDLWISCVKQFGL